VAARNPVVINEHDVYSLTKKGEEELRGADTSLSPAEIELLIRTDGKATVAQITAAVRAFPRDRVVASLQELFIGGWIRTAPKPDPLDIVGFFEAPVPKLSAAAMSKAKSEAASGTATLDKRGHYVRIARRSAKREAKSETISVVVVEDEPHLAKFLKQYLSFEGFDARIAGNRSEIMAALRQAPLPDLVLLDVMLPDADGFDILLKMRAHPVLKSVPVIMLTAKATRESVLRGLAGGADGYITKPFEVDSLIKAVSTVLGLPQNPGSGTLKR